MEQNRSSKVLEEEDPLESMLKKTGCLEKHYEVQVSNCKFVNSRTESLVVEKPNQFYLTRILEYRMACTMLLAGVYCGDPRLASVSRSSR